MSNLGMIVRADNTGLGNQTLEVYSHLKPHKTLIVDRFYSKGLKLYPNRFTKGQVHTTSDVPTKEECDWLLDGTSVVYTAETPYNFYLFKRAAEKSIKTILHVNPEYLDSLHHPEVPHPTVYALPTMWQWDKIPFANKTLLPMPVNLNRFMKREPTSETPKFLHISGFHTIGDRNGTENLLKALRYVKQPLDLTITTQSPKQIQSLVNRSYIPSCVKLNLVTNDVPNYWSLYKGFDVLIMPRRYGGLCLPTLEALGAGMPVIMPDVKPNHEWLNSDMLVPARHSGALKTLTRVDTYDTDPRTLAEKILQFKDPVFYRQRFNEVQVLREQWSWTTLFDEYKTIVWGESSRRSVDNVDPPKRQTRKNRFEIVDHFESLFDE